METRLFALFFIIASLVFVGLMVPGLQAGYTANPMFQTSGLGPAAIPYFAGGATLVLSIVIFFQAKPTKVASTVDGTETGKAGSARPLILFTVILTAYIIAMPFLGFMIGSILFLATVFAVFRPTSLVTAAAVAVIAPVAIDLLLRKAFLIPLPQLALF